MTAAVGWDGPARQLTHALQAYLEDPDATEFLVAVADERRNVYVQFALLDYRLADRLGAPRGTLIGEATGADFLDPPGGFAPGGHDALLRAGWLAETDPRGSGSGNLSRRWSPPYDLAAIADEAVAALADGYGIAPPAELDLRT